MRRSPTYLRFAPIVAAGALACGLWSCARSAQSPASIGGSQAELPFTTPLRGKMNEGDFGSRPPDNGVRLAVRFVSYLDDRGAPTATKVMARQLIARANEIYARCGIQFDLEEYLPVRPREHGIPFHLSSMDQLDPTRAQFDQPNRLVIIDTGDWDHVGMGTANAWTTLPGTTPSGAVLESAVNDHAEIVAHELGHYLDLDHVNDAHNLMNPIIYHSSTRLLPEQCHTLRTTALSTRAASLR